jgi:GTP-binding protein HflX
MHFTARVPRASGVDEDEPPLTELGELAATAGARVCDRVLQTRPSAEAATLIGSGKVEELAELVRRHEADLVIFDNDLTPTQQRNLEKALGARIIDRTQLILDIFAGRARTREGRLQVELAQLNYLLPRLAGRGASMTRQGGGIGTRGPGETQLETDRRRIKGRIKKVEQELESVREVRGVHRRRRTAVPLATVALAGYTNAGKSTLFNRLTEAGVAADARLFATLDPTVRGVTLPSNRRVLLSDTVGFIRDLPTTLVKAFRATLEEVSEAALILHVMDAASPHAAEHAEQVEKVLAEIGAHGTPRLRVWNKIDLLPNPEGLNGVGVSALTGAGIGTLLAEIDRALPFDTVERARFRIPLRDAGCVHLLHEFGEVIEERYDAEYCEVEARAPESVRSRLCEYRIDGGY